ncbi:MAG: M24 family metallopeptidase [Rhizobiaceae bacterium]
MMDFPAAEYETRVERAQRAMRQQNMQALLFTTEAEMRYFTGFRTLFWESPTRPWFLVVPADGKPIAVIPEIGAALMGETWIGDIRTWPSPVKEDEGISLLTDLLVGVSNIGTPMGRESQLRMPLTDFQALRHNLHASSFIDCTPLIAGLRFLKSKAEIDVIRRICGIACDAFDEAPGLFHAGQPMDEAFRAFRTELLRQGVDDVRYLVCGKGPLGYDDVISPPTSQPLDTGDVFMLDTGATLNGYYCDFDRNFAIGEVGDAVKQTHETLWLATEAGLAAARPGATCTDLFTAMQRVIGGGGGVGRYGHGLGMQLTEHPSIIRWDDTVMQEGVVMTLEPSMAVEGGGILVHEENIVIRDGSPELLTRRASRELPTL